MTPPNEREAARQRRPVVLLRPVPGRSAIRDLCAETKFIALLSFSVLLAVLPGWVPIGLVTVVLGVAVWAAHIPRGALPSVPRWMWFVLALGNLTAVFSGRSPNIAVGTIHVGVGGLLEVMRFTALSFVLLGLAALNKWRFGPAIERGDTRAARGFRRCVVSEYVLIAAVLSVTAVMTTFFSPE